MLRRIALLILLITVFNPTFANAEVKVKQLLLMEPQDVSKLLEQERGYKKVFVVMKTDCLPCHKKFVSLLKLKPEERDLVTMVFLSEKAVGFKRYINSFNEIPMRIIYINGSEYELVKNLKKYGVRPWTSLPRVILFDENMQAYGQGAHTADKISIFLSDQEPELPNE